MVRRGSTVRVRQRALQKRRPGHRPFLVQAGFHGLQRAVRMKPFRELSDRGALSPSAGVGRACRPFAEAELVHRREVLTGRLVEIEELAVRAGLGEIAARPLDSSAHSLTVNR
jgi:hypothetical protein